MTSSRFDPGSTSKTLNLSLLRFNKRSGSENLAPVYCSRTHKFHFSVTFSLKMGPTALFTYLKIILLQYFQFQFLISANISSIQAEPIISQNENKSMEVYLEGRKYGQSLVRKWHIFPFSVILVTNQPNYDLEDVWIELIFNASASTFFLFFFSRVFETCGYCSYTVQWTVIAKFDFSNFFQPISAHRVLFTDP